MYFKKSALLFAVIMLLCVSLANTTAQSGETVLVAGVEGNSVYINRISPYETRQKVVFSEGSNYAHVTWDPALLYFIFTYQDAAGKTNLGVSDNMGTPAYSAGEDIAAYIPPRFDTYGNHITYARETSVDGKPALDVYSLGVQGFRGFDDEAVLIATIPFDTDCEPVDLIAPERALEQEIDGAPDAGTNRVIVFLSDYGLIHSEGCAGEKTLLTDVESGETVELGEDLQWVVPSENGSQLAGISNRKLTLVNLETQTVTALDTLGTPSYSILWGPEESNKLYYSTRQQAGQRDLDAEAENAVVETAGQAALGLWNVSIYEYDLTANTERRVYTQVAYGVGEMAATMDNNLVFSQVSRLNNWVDGLIDGTISDPSDPMGVEVNLYRLDLDTGRTILIGENIRQAAISWNAAFG